MRIQWNDLRPPWTDRSSATRPHPYGAVMPSQHIGFYRYINQVALVSSLSPSNPSGVCFVVLFVFYGSTHESTQQKPEETHQHTSTPWKKRQTVRAPRSGCRLPDSPVAPACGPLHGSRQETRQECPGITRSQPGDPRPETEFHAAARRCAALVK